MHHEKRINMSVQEHHEKKGLIMHHEKRINISVQEHHEKKDQHIKSNVPQPSHICVIANHMIATSKEIDWRLILPSFK